MFARKHYGSGVVVQDQRRYEHRQTPHQAAPDAAARLFREIRERVALCDDLSEEISRRRNESGEGRASRSCRRKGRSE
jgi:hypothetical protein